MKSLALLVSMLACAATADAQHLHRHHGFYAPPPQYIAQPQRPCLQWQPVGRPYYDAYGVLRRNMVLVDICTYRY